MDLSTQAKLLRVLERSEFRRVGGTAKVKVDLSHRRGDEPEPRGGDRGRPLPRGPLLSPQGRDARRPAAARAARGHPRARGRVHRRLQPPHRRAHRRGRARRARAARRARLARATCASSATRSRARACSRPATRDARGPRRALAAPPRGLPGIARPRAVARAPARDAGASRRPATAGSVAIPIGCTLAEAERRIVLANLRHYGTRARAAQALGVGLRTLYTKLAAWSREPEDAESA